MSGKKVKSKCSKAQISYANQKYEIYNFNIETVKSIFEKPKWTIMVEMVPDAPCPPHVRMSVIEDNDLIFHIYGLD